MANLTNKISMKKPLLLALSTRQTLVLMTLFFGSVIFGVFFYLPNAQAKLLYTPVTLTCVDEGFCYPTYGFSYGSSTPVSRTLTIHKSGAGSGTVTSSPGGINCGSICSVTFPVCTSVTLTAAPDCGSDFTGWSGGGCMGIGFTCIAQVNSPVDVTVTFEPKPPKRINDFTEETGDNGKVPAGNQADAQDDGKKDSGDDIYFHSGEFNLDIVDLEIPSRGFNFRFERSYKNQISYDGPLGYNWDFNYNMRLAQEKSGGFPTGNIFVLTGQTRKDLYTLNPDETYNSPAGIYNKLTKNEDGSFTLREKDGFKSNYQAFGPVLGGSLVSQQDRNGNTMIFNYNARGALSSVTDTVGRVTNFYYYECGANDGRLSKIRDFSGREVVYTYSEQGDLTEVRSPLVTGTPNGNDFPSGKITKYAYSTGYADNNLNHNILSITNPNETVLDPDGPAVIQNTYGTDTLSPYTYDKVIRQDYGTGRFTYFYSELNPGADPNNLTIPRNKTVAVDRMGNVTEYQHNIKGNRILLKEYTGRVNPTNPVLPPTGKIRPSDPDYYQTHYTYNTNGQITRIIYPKGNAAEYTYDAANPDVYQKGNVLEEARRPYPGASDPDSIVKSYTYETNYNFVKTATDPKGNVTTNNYNPANGDLLSIQYPNVTSPAPQNITKSFTYNLYGQVLIKTSGEGNKTEYQYTGYGYLYRTIIDPDVLHLTTEYTYDSVGNISTTKDPKGNITTYNVNALNQVVKATGPSPVSEQKLYYYDANNNQIKTEIQNKDKDNVLDPVNPWLTDTFVYNILNKQTSKTEEVGLTKTVSTQYEYDSNDNLKRITQPAGNRSLTSYDERDLVYQTTRGEGTAEVSTTTKNYDGNENLKTLVDGRGKTTTYNYDDFDRLTELVDALGNKQIQAYDKSSNIIQSKAYGPLNESTPGNIRLSQTDFLYDEINRLYQTNEAFFNPADQSPYEDGLKTTTSFFDRNSRLYQETDDKGHSTYYYYDQADRLKKTVDALSNEAENVYDANSNVTQVIEKEISQLPGHPVHTYTTTNVYDELNRVKQKTDNLSQSEYYAYDSRNNQVWYKDKKGNTTDYTYDGLNRQLSTTYDLRDNGRGSGSVTDTILTSQTWDDNSRLASQTDDNGHVTQYTYDPLNRLIRKQNDDDTYYTYAYDENDNTLQVIDPNGSVITNAYDDTNRLAGKSAVPGIGVVAGNTYTYGYDGLSRMTKADVSGVPANETYSYDSLGNLRLESMAGYSTSSYYDAVGNRTYITYPNDDKMVARPVDELNRVSNILDTGSYLSQFIYVGPTGRLEQADNLENDTQTVLSYDLDKRITDVLHQKTTPETFAQFQYGYDEENNILYEKKIQSPWNGKGDVYVYDSVYQIKTAKLGVDDPVAESQAPGTGGNIQTKINYNLDGVGNRTSVVTDDTTTVTYTPNNVNEYTAVGADSFTYDANGNLKNNGVYDFFYDYRNQLVRVEDTGTHAVVVNYSYDPLGRRIGKVAAGTTTKYIYDGQNLIQERDSDYALVATYIYGLGIDAPIKMDRGGSSYYYHKDALGSVTAVTDGSGNVVEKYDYDPYGNVTIRNVADIVIPESAIGNTFMFTGREYDKETSLYYYRNRYYDPEIGRFLQRDPIGTWADAYNLGNGYSYVGNNAVNFTDPSGLKPPETTSPPLTYAVFPSKQEYYIPSIPVEPTPETPSVQPKNWTTDYYVKIENDVPNPSDNKNDKKDDKVETIAGGVGSTADLVKELLAKKGTETALQAGLDKTKTFLEHAVAIEKFIEDPSLENGMALLKLGGQDLLGFALEYATKHGMTTVITKFASKVNPVMLAADVGWTIGTLLREIPGVDETAQKIMTNMILNLRSIGDAISKFFAPSNNSKSSGGYYVPKEYWYPPETLDYNGLPMQK